MKPTEVLAYLAGIIDGEGWITIIRGGNAKGRRKYAYQILLGCSMTRPEVVQLLRSTFQGTIALTAPRNEKHSPQFRWEVRSQQAAGAIKMLRPFLILKTKQADLALAIQETMQFAGKIVPTNIWEARDKMKAQMTILNRRGQEKIA